MIDVLIVDDLKSARNLIRDILISDPQIHVCGMTEDGDEAVRMVRKLQPHLVILDSQLKRVSGNQVAEKIMEIRPTPIIMLARETDAQLLAPERLFLGGVLDVVNKGDLYRYRTRSGVAEGFIRKIKLLSKIDRRSIGKRHKSSHKKPDSGGSLRKGFHRPVGPQKKHDNRIIAIVSSTGGPNALFQIIHALPADFSAPILIVQHMSPGFIHGLAEWLNQENHVRVRVAEQDALPMPGEASLAPDNAHLTVDNHRHIQLLDAPPVGGHKPSGNTLLESVAQAYGPDALGVILTGMGNDGAAGMAALKKAGGKSIVQDQGTSVIFGMPRAAIALGVADRILPLQEIASAISKFAKTGF